MHAMYLRAGVLSVSLLLLSRVLGLLRESVQAAAFGATGMADVVIVMFTLPDLLVGMALSGALSYVLVPLWAQQTRAQQRRSQAAIARALLGAGVIFGAGVWLARGALVHALAPGLQGGLSGLAANALAWSALALPLAILAALWTTRLQHERDFVGVYAGSVWVNAALVVGVLVVAIGVPANPWPVLGGALLAGAVARLVWLRVRLHRATRTVFATPAPTSAPTSAQLAVQTFAPDMGSPGLPKPSVWLWAALCSGLLLLLPLMARSLASATGGGALASFNYAWKLVELPLVLAVQLVASLAFPAITRTQPGSAARSQALHIAFALAWALACAAVAAVATFALPLAQLLFGWGRMGTGELSLIAQWAGVGVWSLLPQALVAVLLTVMAARQHMRAAVWAHAGGALGLALAGWLGVNHGAAVMLALNAALGGVALALLVSQRQHIKGALHGPTFAVPLLVCTALVLTQPWLAGVGLWGLPLAGLYALVVLGSAFVSSPLLKARLKPSKRLPLTDSTP